MESCRSRRWTPEEVGRLRSLAYRHPVNDIAQMLERTPGAVRTKAAHARIPLIETSHPGQARRPLPWNASRG